MSEEARLDEFTEEATEEGERPEQKIPEGWQVHRADEIMEITRGASPRPKGDPELFGGDIPWVKIGDVDVKDSRYTEETEDTVTEKGAKKSKLVDEGTLLVSNSGTCGYPMFAGRRSCVHDGWLILQEYEDSLNAHYLYEHINWKQNHLKSLAPGSTQINLNTSRFGVLEINTPPLPEQRKIATVLHTVDRAIEKTERVIGHYENLQTGLLRKHFGKPSVQVDYSDDRETKRLGPKSYTVPKDWETVQISDVGKVVTGDTPSTKNEDYYGGDLPFVTPEDFGEAKRVYRGSRGLTDEGRQKSRPIPEDAVMMDCIGMDMGKVRIAGRELATNQQINSIVVNTEKVLPEFLYFHLKAISNLIQSQAGQTRTPIVSKSQFSSFEIFKPPISAQEDVVNSLSVFDELIEKESEYVAQLRRLKRGLMQDLLSGTVRTTDTNIEVPEEIAKYG